MPERLKKPRKGFKTLFSRERHNAGGPSNPDFTNIGPAHAAHAPQGLELVSPSSSTLRVAQAPLVDNSSPPNHGQAQMSVALAATPASPVIPTPPPLNPSDMTNTGTEAQTNADDIEPWTAAFHLFQEKSPDLAASYEKCLVSLLGMTADDVKLAVPRSVETVVQTQLKRREGKQWKLPLPLGKTINVRKQTEKLVKLLLYFDPIVKDAVSAQPYAALAWSSVSMLLSLLTNTTIQNEAMLDGFNSINDILVYWNAGEEILRKGNTGAHFLKSLSNLYASIIEYQASVICHISSGQGSRALKSVVGAVDWAKKAQKIAQLNTACKDLVDISCRADIQRANDSTLQGMRDIVVALEQSEQQTHGRERDEKEAELLRNLQCPYDSYKDFNRQRVHGTCEWFFNDDRFHAWRDASTSSLLWVSAGPGCGKSVLSRAIVDDLRASTAGGSSTVCHFFFKHGDEDRTLAANALSAILHGLFTEDASQRLIQHALPSHKSHGKRLAQDFLELWKILTSCAQSDDAGEIICVLDALDECEQQSRHELLDRLRQFYRDQQPTSAKASKLKFVITSRPYDDLEKQFAGFATANCIQFHGDDKSAEISREIDFVIDELVDEVAGSFSRDDKKRLKTHLKGMTNRTYLWLHLTFDIIRQSPCEFGRPCDIDELLSILPSQVADAYENILNRSKNKKRTETILSIVLAAERPLTLREANVAVAMAFALQNNKSPPPSTSAELDKQLWPEKTFKSVVTNLCGLFLSVYDEKLVFIHQTAREFLVGARGEGNVWQGRFALPTSHSVMSSICVRYLLLQEIHVSYREYFDRITRRRFLDYAAKHWHRHLAAQDPTARFDLLSEARILLDGTDIRNQAWMYQSSKVEVLYGMTSLTVASLFCLTSVVEDMLKTGKVDINKCDAHGNTALHHAAKEGHTAIVWLLLDKGADIYVRNRFDDTAFRDAADNGHTETVKLLLDNGADINVRSIHGYTALHVAAIRDDSEIVQLLLKEGADVNARDSDRWTPLHRAAEGRSNKIFRLLLDNGADIHVRSKDGETPLWYAAYFGNSEMVRLLLEKGANVDVLNRWGESILHYTADNHAAENGHTEALGLLLAKGADIHVQNAKGNTALHISAKYGYTEAVRLFLDHGANIDAQNRDGQTALYKALQENHMSVIRLLLEYGADVFVQDVDGRTALEATHESDPAKATEILSIALELLGKRVDDFPKQDLDGLKELAARVESSLATAHRLYEKWSGIAIELTVIASPLPLQDNEGILTWQDENMQLAHGGLANYTVGDPPVWYRGYDPDENAAEQDGQPWMVQRKWASIDPIFTAADPFLACNKPGTPGPAYIPVAAGQNLTAVYWYWLHPVGPMSAWLAACPPLDEGGCVGVDVNALRWFKIWEAGLLAGTGNLAEGIWYQKQFQHWDGSPDLWPVTIPASLQAGLYVVRHEIVSIHIANRPQFYPECAHLNITGGGTELPPTSFYKTFPGAYSVDDYLSTYIV
ncbi:ankyrin repeat-containing protein [Sporothrix brasiliensis 5110]|uniref:Ankyrin repeat-containing protein n=1 Tax=Sporothrix brasiliensis 5110 TaxID=1398154 RepID=A0A0C2IW73_9PEZI|nr:ankyrin repeat-containing protein [Sporothrix brasiliensis 5110]KIH91045.1 ankyrin repeat-containing protein [Sporothrix brasiliensis 5110]